MKIDDRFFTDARVFCARTSDRQDLIDQMNLILKTIQEVQKKGSRAKLPKEWKYHYPRHELTVEVGDPDSISKLLRLVINRGQVAATDFHAEEHNAYRLVIALVVV